MKKKIFLFLIVLSVLACLLAISVSASSQSYTTFDVTLTDGTQKTAYSAGSDQWEGRIFLNSKLFAEAPFDTEGTYEEIDWTTVKEMDFTNAMLYIYDKNNKVWNEKAYGSNQGGTALCLYPNGISRANQLTSLEKVTTGKLVTLREGAFNSAPALKELIINNNLLYMQNNVFNKCTALERVICLPGSKLISINDSFTHCTALTTVVLGAQMTTVGSNAFYGCTALSNISFLNEDNGGAELTIKSSAFQNCKALKSIDFLPSNVVKLESNAFNSCISLTSIYIPANITYIGSDCFRNCSGITSIEFDPNCQITHLYAHTFDGTKATTVTVPNTVQQIGQNCFSISTLESLNLGASFVGFNASNVTQPPISASSTLKYLYLSNTFTSEYLRDGILNWDDTPGNQNELKERYLNLTVFYSGSKDAAEAIINKATSGGTDGAPINQYFASMELMSAEEYANAVKNGTLVEGVKNSPKRYFVYDYNKCEAFYASAHKWTGDTVGDFTGTKFFSTYEIKDSCTVCKLNDVKETIETIFVSRGYSIPEIEGKYEILVDFAINHDALEAYNNNVEDDEQIVEYGLYAALCEKVTDGDGFKEGTKKASVNYMEKPTKYDLFTMKITGLEDYQETPFFITAYFKVGDEYLFYNASSNPNIDATVDNKLISQVTYK